MAGAVAVSEGAGAPGTVAKSVRAVQAGQSGRTGEGAASRKELGVQFTRKLARTRILIFLSYVSVAACAAGITYLHIHYKEVCNGKLYHQICEWLVLNIGVIDATVASIYHALKESHEMSITVRKEFTDSMSPSQHYCPNCSCQNCMRGSSNDAAAQLVLPRQGVDKYKHAHENPFHLAPEPMFDEGDLVAAETNVETTTLADKFYDLYIALIGPAEAFFFSKKWLRVLFLVVMTLFYMYATFLMVFFETLEDFEKFDSELLEEKKKLFVSKWYFFCYVKDSHFSLVNNKANSWPIVRARRILTFLRLWIEYTAAWFIFSGMWVPGRFTLEKLDVISQPSSTVQRERGKDDGALELVRDELNNHGPPGKTQKGDTAANKDTTATTRETLKQNVAELHPDIDSSLMSPGSSSQMQAGLSKITRHQGGNVVTSPSSLTVGIAYSTARPTTAVSLQSVGSGGNHARGENFPLTQDGNLSGISNYGAADTDSDTRSNTSEESDAA